MKKNTKSFQPDSPRIIEQAKSKSGIMDGKNTVTHGDHTSLDIDLYLKGKRYKWSKKILRCSRVAYIL
jgi:hypothetical protein